jgi:protein-disulfide isomerase
LLGQYGSSIRYEFRHFPLRSLHPQALAAAEAAECAADQGKFWEYVGLAFSEQKELSREKLLAWAAEISLDTSSFEPCLASESKRALVLSEYEEGRRKGVLGTPTFFVNGKKVESRLGPIRQAIEAVKATGGAAR